MPTVDYLKVSLYTLNLSNQYKDEAFITKSLACTEDLYEVGIDKLLYRLTNRSYSSPNNPNGKLKTRFFYTGALTLTNASGKEYILNVLQGRVTSAERVK